MITIQYLDRYDPDADPVVRNSAFSGECGGIDLITDQWLTELQTPDGFEYALREILQEIQILRNHGLLKPFVEGEPIGKYVKVRRATPNTTEIDKYMSKRMEWQRQDMLALRAKNDRDMESFLARSL